MKTHWAQLYIDGLFLILFMIGGIVATAQPAGPRLLPFQGRLTDQDGVPVTNGMRVVQFKIFDGPTAVTPVWAGEIHRTTINGGLVNVILGTKTSFPQTTEGGLFFDQQLYLEITVDIDGDNQITSADPPMLPRQIILPVIFAKDTAKLAGRDWSSILVSGNDPDIGKIRGAKIENQGITAAQIANGTIASAQIANGAITSTQILDGTISASDIQDGSITGASIQDGSITGADIADGSITGADIADGSITGANLANGTVSDIKIVLPLVFGYNDAGVTALWVANITSGEAVRGTSATGYGIYGYSGEGNGVAAGATTGGGAVYAFNVVGGTAAWLASDTHAAWFNGDVYVSGKLEKPGGGFKIDHPLDPSNKTLTHSFVESSDMKNLYDGIAELNVNGEAEVAFPAWFGALNKDYRYQLTALGMAGPNLHISKEIADNHFTIAGGSPGMKVSWQITGIRKDDWANANRFIPEQDKPAKERATFLTPEAHGQPKEKGVHFSDPPRTQLIPGINTPNK